MTSFGIDNELSMPNGINAKEKNGSVQSSLNGSHESEHNSFDQTYIESNDLLNSQSLNSHESLDKESILKTKSSLILCNDDKKKKTFTSEHINEKIIESSSNDTANIKVTEEMKCFNSSNVCGKINQHSEKDCYKAFEKSVFEDSSKLQSNTYPQIEAKTEATKPGQGFIVEWDDDQHQADMIHCLNVFRKSKQFCDLVLMVGGNDLYCHRVVVGGASRSILEALCRGEQESGPVARIPVDNGTRKPGLSPFAVEILIDYMYTSKLSFSSEHLTAVYCAALQLSVKRVIQICRRHVIAALDTDQCIQMRRICLNYGDTVMKSTIDNFVEENFEAVVCGKEFLALPRIKVEIKTSPNPSVANLLFISSKNCLLSSTTLKWISNLVELKGGSFLEDLTEQIQRISLEELNNTAVMSPSNHGQTYMFRTSHENDHRKLNEGPFSNRIGLTRSSSMDSIDSSNSSSSTSRLRCSIDGEWKVIASMQSSETEHTISLCSVGDVLCALSIRLPDLSNGDANNLNNGISTEQTASNHFSSGSSSSTSCSSSIGSSFQIQPMKQPRSAAGIAQIDGKLIVAGGFNQSECLDTVECLDVSANRWSSLPRMGEKRGRFSVAVLRGQLYAVGGSTGSSDLRSVERYDPIKEVWSYVQPLQFCCSEAGVAVLDDLLYCVGGVQQNTGIAGLKYCQVYDPTLDQWEYRASTRIARSSLGVARLGAHLYAVGGSDGWKCLSSSERYDPVSNQWSFTAPLNIQRRGLGLVEHNGSLYCFGGSDGQSFLASVERYNAAEGDLWTLTSWSLAVPRNNAGLVSMNGCIFVAGGFSGRQFLSSVETVEDNINEWSAQESSAFKSASSDSKDSCSSSNE